MFSPTLYLFGLFFIVLGGCTRERVLPNFQECVSSDSSRFQYCNRSLSVEQRIDWLINALTLDEKVAFISPSSAVSTCYTLTPGAPRVGIGPYMWLEEINTAADAYCDKHAPCVTTFSGPLGLAATFNRTVWAQKGTVVSSELRALNNAQWYRLGGPWYPLGLTGFGPNINILRDPRFGRASELPGEDPLLNGEYAIEYTKQLEAEAEEKLEGPGDGVEAETQRSAASTSSSSRKYKRILAYIKHFDAYSLEADRMHYSATIPPFDLHDSYLPAYHAVFTRGSISGGMCSYTSINGVPSCYNGALLNTLVKETWGRPDAVTMSDCQAVSSGRGAPLNFPSDEMAAAAAFNNGTDIEAGSTLFNRTLPAAVRADLVPIASVDDALRRILRQFFQAGRFDPPEVVPWTSLPRSVVGSAEHTHIRDSASAQAFVLQRNLGGALPLRSGEKIAVIGPLGNKGKSLMSDYYGDAVCPGVTWDPPTSPPISKLRVFDCVPTLYEAIRAANVGGTTSFVEGVNETFLPPPSSSTATAARSSAASSPSITGFPDWGAVDKAVGDADVIIATVGFDLEVAAEGRDRVFTGLPGWQELLIAHLTELALLQSKRLIILVVSGGAVTMNIPRRPYRFPDGLPEMYKSVTTADPSAFPDEFALVQVFNPAFGAPALARVLFGQEQLNSGRFPFTSYNDTWYTSNNVTEYEMAAASGRTYRYVRGGVQSVFGEGMSSWGGAGFTLNCSLSALEGTVGGAGPEMSTGATRRVGLREGAAALYSRSAGSSSARSISHTDGVSVETDILIAELPPISPTGPQTAVDLRCSVTATTPLRSRSADDVLMVYLRPHDDVRVAIDEPGLTGGMRSEGANVGGDGDGKRRVRHISTSNSARSMVGESATAAPPPGHTPVPLRKLVAFERVFVPEGPRSVFLNIRIPTSEMALTSRSGEKVYVAGHYSVDVWDGDGGFWTDDVMIRWPGLEGA